MSVVHKQGLNGFSEVEKCVLEPNGTSMWKRGSRTQRRSDGRAECRRSGADGRGESLNARS